MKKIFTAFILFLIFVLSTTYSKNDNGLKEQLSKGLVFKLNEENSFIKIGYGLQAWGRYMEFNPGTLDYDNNVIDRGVDMSLRRTFVSFSGVIDRFTFFSLLSMDSQTPEVILGPFGNKKPDFFFYDAWMSYDIIPNYMAWGFGLNMFNGTSRYASASSSRTLGADPIVIGVPNLLTTEQLGRQMSFFLTGQYELLNYRIAVAKPFIADTRPDFPLGVGTYEIPNTYPSVKSYITLQFLDKESYKMPFKSSTYLGEGRYFNIGFGVDYHKNATATYMPKGRLRVNSKLHLGADIFYDAPITEKSSITFYLGAFYFDYGDDYYLLSYGVMNPFPNALNQYQQGTGRALHLETAYLFPFRVLDKHKLQAFIQLTYRDFKAIPEPNIHYNYGLNYYFAGHHIKTGIQMEHRPFWKDLSQSYKYYKTLTFKTQLFF